MSEILIKGLKIKDYPQTITINPDGSVIKDTFGLHRLVEEWKAIELPTHGRLGDLDALQKQIEDDIEAVAKEKGKVGLRELWQILNKNLEDAPTIIEAST